MTDAESPGPAARLLILLVRCYQAALRPVFGGHCRFIPSCSEYALEALRRHGCLRGSWLAVWRVCRCHPFGGAGFDPVPERKTVSGIVSRPDSARRGSGGNDS